MQSYGEQCSQNYYLKSTSRNLLLTYSCTRLKRYVYGSSAVSLQGTSLETVAS